MQSNKEYICEMPQFEIHLPTLVHLT